MREVTPNYFIVGAHKCATTFMAEHLRQHPDVFMTEPKEPQHFSRDICPELTPYSDPKRYQDLFRSVRHEKAIGEASAWYLYSQVAADAIQRVNPDARIIIMLRNPVDFLHSIHSEFVLCRQEPILDFEQAIELDYRGRVEHGMAPGSLFECGFDYRKAARFSHQVSRYLERFPRDQIHFVLFDDVKASPAATYASVLRFLEVDDSFTPTFNPTNVNKIIRAPRLLDALQYPSKLKSAVARALPPTVRRRLIDLTVRLATEEAPRQPMRPELRRRLMADYDDEVGSLSGLINRDLSAWMSELERETQHG